MGLLGTVRVVVRISRKIPREFSETCGNHRTFLNASLQSLNHGFESTGSAAVADGDDTAPPVAAMPVGGVDGGSLPGASSPNDDNGTFKRSRREGGRKSCSVRA